MSKSTSKKTQTESSVAIVDGKLILSLPNAEMPVVWQMDLEKAQSAAFTVTEDKKAKTFTLVSKTSDNDTDDIAVFKDKQDAVDTLMETSEVLQSAHGKIKATTTSAKAGKAPANDTHQSDKMGALLAFALVIVLIIIWMISASGRIDPIDGDLAASSTSSATPGNARESSGVPVSADDFLNNR